MKDYKLAAVLARSAGVIAVAMLLPACSNMSGAPAVTHDGLVQVESAAFAQVYAKPGATVAPYNQFALADCEVSFRKNWLRDQNDGRRSVSSRVSDDDMTKIRESLSALCNQEFSGVLLADPAYTVVTADAANAQTLLLTPSIINLDVAAPDVPSPGITRTYTTESGEMTLLLEVADASTGEVLYRVVDRRRDRGTMRLEWSNSVTNIADAKRILKLWGRQLREGLDRVMATQNSDDGA